MSTGRKCIYCGGSTQKSRSVAHVFPAAIFPDGPALPRGIVCDNCNHYFGAKLEAVLVGYPLVALPLQLAALPGKKGKPRGRIGIFDRESHPDAAVTFEVEEPEITVDANGVSTATVSVNPAVDPGFDIGRLRRALHHIAVNLLILNEGVETARSDEYLAVRKYVRAPRKHERWPFIQVTEQFDILRHEIGAWALNLSGAKLIRIRMFNTDYYVDLHNSGCLLTARMLDSRAHLIDPDWKPRPRKGQSKRFRISIY